MMARSAPSAAAASVSDPPISASWISPESRAGMPVELAMLVNSTFRPCCLKIPASKAIHTGRLVAIGLLYETFREAAGAGGAVGAAAGWVVAAVVGAAVGAAGLAAVGAGVGAVVGGAGAPAGWQ